MKISNRKALENSILKLIRNHPNPRRSKSYEPVKSAISFFKTKKLIEIYNRLNDENRTLRIN